MKENRTLKIAGIVLLVLFLPIASLALAQTSASAKGIATGADTPEDYDSLQKDLKQAQRTDALQRIRMLEQQQRCLSKRIELLERKVDDIRNERY